MSYGIRFGEGMQVTPLAIQEGTVNLESGLVNCSGANWVSLLLAFGDCDTAVTVTVQAATSGATTSAITIPFVYRLSGAVSAGSDTWGAITTADSTGFALTAQTDTGKLTLIEINPAELPDGYNYVGVVTAATSYNSPTPAHVVVAFLESRYGARVMPSST